MPHALDLIFDVFKNPKWRRNVMIISVFLVGTYLLLTQGGEVRTERVVFIGWNVQGYTFFTTGSYDVCTDPMNQDDTMFHLYHYSLGWWSPLDNVDKNDDMDIDSWYNITYQKTLLGNKLIKVELG